MPDAYLDSRYRHECAHSTKVNVIGLGWDNFGANPRTFDRIPGYKPHTCTYGTDDKPTSIFRFYDHPFELGIAGVLILGKKVDRISNFEENRKITHAQSLSTLEGKLNTLCHVCRVTPGACWS